MKPTPGIKRRRAQLAAIFTLAADYILTRECYYACVALECACVDEGMLEACEHAFASYFKPPKAKGHAAWWPDLLRFHYVIWPRPRRYIRTQNARAFGLLLMAELARSGDLD